MQQHTCKQDWGTLVTSVIDALLILTTLLATILCLWYRG